MNSLHLFKRRTFIPIVNKTFVNKSKTQYDIALENYKKGISKRENRRKFYKFVYYLFGISFGAFYIYYVGKASGIFKSLRINHKYKEHVKNVQEKHKIDQENIDMMIKNFDEKYEINKQIDQYEEKLKYGNKELNERVQENLKENIEKEEESTNDVQTIDLFNREEKEKQKELLLEEYNNYGENIIYTKSDEFEQLKILQNSEEENPDPRIMGNTIIFDSRLNSKSNKYN